MKEVVCVCVDWFRVSQDRVQWWALMNTLRNVRFQVLTATSMKMTVFWVVAPCCLVDIDRRFRAPSQITRPRKDSRSQTNLTPLAPFTKIKSQIVMNAPELLRDEYIS
jgi:hypothetical protein